MKSVLFALLVLFASFVAYAGHPGEMYAGVPDSGLTQDQLRMKNEALAIKKVSDAMGVSPSVLSEVGQFAKGFGFGMAEFLRELKTTAIDLSKEDVGKFAMFLFAWVYFGSQFFYTIIGMILWFSITFVIAWSYRRTCMPRRVLIEKGDKGARKYQVIPPAFEGLNRSSGTLHPLSGLRLLHATFWFVMSGIVFIIIF
jgi:hypothetical protein